MSSTEMVATAMVPSDDSVELGKPLEGDGDVTVAFDDLKFSVVNGKLQAAILQVKEGKTEILHGVSGRISSRRVMAIIGPSGSGKTTLLEALAQQPYLVNDKSVSITGQMRVQEGGAAGAWKPLTRNFLSEKCSFMPQHDALWPALTAYENLAYAALLFASAGAGVTAAIDARVTQKLGELGLTGCRDVLVGSPFLKGLSGGQKRRLSLGCNMMKENVKVLFLDEPTSGLDAASAAEVMRLITSLAKSQGFAVLCSIHQPSSHVFYAFDQVLLLSKGRVAY
jgi:ABC-type multidrug transport system ATPase subunit